MAARRPFHLAVAVEKQSADVLCPPLGDATFTARVVGRGEEVAADQRQHRQRLLPVGHGQPAELCQRHVVPRVPQAARPVLRRVADVEAEQLERPLADVVGASEIHPVAGGSQARQRQLRPPGAALPLATVGRGPAGRRQRGVGTVRIAPVRRS